MVQPTNSGHSHTAINKMGFWCSLSVLAFFGVTALGFPRPDEYNIPEIPFGSRAQFSVLHDDGTFKYGYDTGSGIYEKATKMGGNVNGYFGYTDAEGKNVRLDYTAGGEGGFVPKLSVDGAKRNTYSSPSAAQTQYSSNGNGRDSVPVVKSAYDNSKFSSNNFKSDASYSFSYQNPKSSRREEADADLNVKGDYSFVDDDGVRRQVNYIAGSDTGFVAEADFLPKAPLVPASHGQVALTYDAPAQPENTLLVKSAADHSQISSGPRNDASYSFSYNTGDSSRREESDTDLNIKGDYSFVADDGVRRQVNYIAGSGTGFVAEADFLPKAPEVPASHGQGALTYDAPAQPESTLLVKSAADHSQISSGARNDASYSFSYNTGDSSRREEADADLNIKGDYSFVADDGVRRQVNYIAGSGTGFVAEADFLPKAPEVPASHGQVALTYDAPAQPESTLLVKSAADHSQISSGARNDASYSFSYNTGDSSRREEADADLNVKGDYSFVADDGVRRQVNYIAGSDTGFVAEADFLPKAPEVPASHGQVALTYHAPAQSETTPLVKSAADHSQISSGARNDASYRFSYNAGDSSRREEADADLNVKGDYSFVADDGVRRQVNYIAGSDTGFVAEADFLPKAPEVPAPHGQVALTYDAPALSESTPLVKSAADHSQISSGARNDASYSFSYNTGDSSRREEADADLNVKGDYSFVADDGVRRQVNYIAGSDTGFVAEADFLPKAPEVPASHGQVGLTYDAPALSETTPLVKSAADHSQITSGARNDASYSFSYNTGDSSRREEADADLNVKGDYSFVADDGVRRQINYIAGSETGFVAEGDFLPKAPAVPVSHDKATLKHAVVVHHTGAPVVPSKQISGSSGIGQISLSHKKSSPVLVKSSDFQRNGCDKTNFNSFKCVVGDVLLRQYLNQGKKYGYVFTAV